MNYNTKLPPTWRQSGGPSRRKSCLEQRAYLRERQGVTISPVRLVTWGHRSLSYVDWCLRNVRRHCNQVLSQPYYRCLKLHSVGLHFSFIVTGPQTAELAGGGTVFRGALLTDSRVLLCQTTTLPPCPHSLDTLVNLSKPQRSNSTSLHGLT